MVFSPLVEKVKQDQREHLEHMAEHMMVKVQDGRDAAKNIERDNNKEIDKYRILWLVISTENKQAG